MRKIKIFISAILTLATLTCFAQVENAGVVKKRTEKDIKDKVSPSVTDRMQSLYQKSQTHDADLSYMKQVYRKLDLAKTPNSALYYPEDYIEGQENLFRIILKQVINGNIPAYEYLDGKEIFSDQYSMNVGDILNRFDIFATEAKGSTEKNPKYVVDDSDIPSSQVLNYYIIERWEFDNRSNDMKTIVEAICPVLNRYGDFDDEMRYPMFWVKFDDLRPYLSQQLVFVDDDNNLPKYSLDDFFTMNLYKGDIYKTRNNRNLSMAQMFPDEDDMRNAQDSIDNYLKNYGKNLWVPTREEYLEMKNADKEANETVVEEREAKIDKGVSSRSKKKSKQYKPKSNTANTSSNAEKSVRRRKR